MNLINWAFRKKTFFTHSENIQQILCLVATNYHHHPMIESKKKKWKTYFCHSERILWSDWGKQVPFWMTNNLCEKVLVNHFACKIQKKEIKKAAESQKSHVKFCWVSFENKELKKFQWIVNFDILWNQTNEIYNIF